MKELVDYRCIFWLYIYIYICVMSIYSNYFMNPIEKILEAATEYEAHH